MPTAQTPTPPADNGHKVSEGTKRPLPPAAERALAEAAARRAQAAQAEQTDPGGPKTEAPKEVAGRGGLDPARYGDWEINGLISDF